MDQTAPPSWQSRVNSASTPSQPDPSIVEASSSSKSGKSPLKIGLLTLFIFFLMVMFVVGLTASVAYASVDIPFLSDKTEKQIKLLYFSVPFTPKTAEQILIAASEQNSMLTTYNPSLSFSGNFDSANLMLGSVDLKVSGPIDITSIESPQFDLTAEAGINYGGSLYSVSAKFRKIDEALYSKIDSISDSILDTYLSFYTLGVSEVEAPDKEVIKQKLAPVFANWIVYDLSGIDSEARDMLKQQEHEQMSTIEEAQDAIEKLLSDDQVLPEVTRLDDETIEGVATYHLQVIPSKETLTYLIESWYEQQGEKVDEDMREALDASVASVERFTIDVWFGKDDLVLRKAAVTSSISLTTLLETAYAETNEDRIYGTPLSGIVDLVDPRINTSAVLVLRDVGVPVTVTVPSPVMDQAQYSTLLQEALYDEKMLEALYGQDPLYEDQNDMLLGVFDYMSESD